MKKTALLAAAAALAAASPAVAHGYLGVEYGTGSIDTGGPSTDTDIWQGEGAIGFGGTGWGSQIDGSFGTIDASGGSADAYTLGGHLWWDGGGWRLGGVVAYSQVSDFVDIDEWAYGIEGTWDFNSNAGVVSSLTAGTADAGLGGDIDLWNWDAGVYFFPNPNFSVGGFFGFGNADGGGGGGDTDTMSFGVNGEFQPWSWPISFTLGWNDFEIDDTDTSSDVFTIGARWNFGGGTLQERHNAAPFDTNTGFVDRLYGVW